MDGNRDEGAKCLRIAEKYIRAGDREKAIKFLHKAERLYPSKRAKGLCVWVSVSASLMSQNSTRSKMSG